jgi:replicative DNA helicase
VSSVRLGKLNLVPEIKNASEQIKLEREKRKDISILPFGISYLDDALNGIRKDDFVLIGAKTGLGKTALATSIAMNNARIGKRVFFFALEAAELEIERRIKYQILSHIFYNVTPDSEEKRAINLNYMDWYDGKIKQQVIIDAESAIEETWTKDFETLKVVYRQNSEYTVENLTAQMSTYQDQADLFVIDHLHYFDFDDQNENRAYKTIMKKISDMAQILKIPVVMVAHLRKSDKSAKSLIPSEDDFHGTSDIVKIPTKIITIAAARSIERTPQMIADYSWPTFFRIAKCRTESARCNFPGVVLFSAFKNCYEQRYKIGSLSYDESEWKQIEVGAYPKWAKKYF